MLGSCADYLIREPQGRFRPRHLLLFAGRMPSSPSTASTTPPSSRSKAAPTPSTSTACRTTCSSYSRNQNTQEFGQGTHGSSSVYALNFWSRGWPRDLARQHPAGLARPLLRNNRSGHQHQGPAAQRGALPARVFLLGAHRLFRRRADVPRTGRPGRQQTPHTPKAQVVEQILGDLEEAAKYLPVTYAAEDTGRATGAALAPQRQKSRTLQRDVRPGGRDPQRR